MNLDISGLLENSNALIINPLWISRDFDVVALSLLVHLSYCVPLLTIQMLVSFHNFIKYKSLGSLSQRAITPLAIFYLAVALNDGMCSR